MDMTQFPYQVGDVLTNGVQVAAIRKGDASDSFAGYRYRRSMPPDEDGNVEWQEFESKKKLPNMKKITVGGESFNSEHQEICIIGNPDAAYVYYSVPGIKKGQGCKPEEFLEKYPYDKFMGKPEPEKPVVTAAKCAALTANEKPCQRPAGFGQDGLYCPQHAKAMEK